MISTKNQLLNYLIRITREYESTSITNFSAQELSDEIMVSRSVCSLYLNEFAKAGILVKIKTRPVYFLHKATLERMFNIELDLDYLSIEDLELKLFSKSTRNTSLDEIIGRKGSLKKCIDLIEAGIKYPPIGLPIMILGHRGSGRTTLGEKIYLYANSNNILDKNGLLEVIEVNSKDPLLEGVSKRIFGYKDTDKEYIGAIERSNSGIVLIENAHLLSLETQIRLKRFIQTQHFNVLNGRQSVKSNARIVLTADIDQIDKLDNEFMNSIPLRCEIPSLSNWFYDEKIELIHLFLRKEAQKIHVNIYINMQIVDALASSNYDLELLGLKQTITLMCANAHARNNDSFEELYLYVYDLPKSINVDAIKVSYTSEEYTEYYNVNTFILDDESSRVINVMESLLELYEEKLITNHYFDDEVFVNDAYNLLRQYYDYLVFEKKYELNRIKIIEKNIQEIVDEVLRKQNINMPVSCSIIMSRILYFNRDNLSLVNQWTEDNSIRVNACLKRIKSIYEEEYFFLNTITQHIRNNLGLTLSPINQIVLLLYLIHHNSEINGAKYLGVIVAHGYATASSIANTANTLLDKYVFDAIDMPIDTSIEDIVNKLNTFIRKSSLHTDVVALVDMGSLEDIGTMLQKLTDRNIIVFNNVSTLLALDVGNKIIQGLPIEDLVENVTELNKTTYTLISNDKERKRVIFTSENGPHMAKRMADLFLESLPRPIDVDTIVYDYNELKSYMLSDSSTRNIMFVSGTSNPGVPDELFISLDEIVGLDGFEKIEGDLLKYLSPDEIRIFIQNLIKNFSFQNIVKNLTILEPNALIEAITDAISALQQKMESQFSSKTIVGIYIHVSCLVERLVTRAPIESRDNLEEFSRVHRMFIKAVNESFEYLLRHYGVELPLSEIAYLYDYIEADIKEKEPIEREWTL